MLKWAYNHKENKLRKIMAAYNPCVLIPTFNNPKTIRQVVLEVREYTKNILVVDDGSDFEGYRICQELAQSELAKVLHRPTNGGKGAAVKSGLSWAQELGFSHALQVDADGQHDLQHIPDFMEQGSLKPLACIVGYPRYDKSAPIVRRVARRFTQFWVDIEAGRGVIKDAMVGFRLYPIKVTLEAGVLGNRMDFDVEVPIRLVWMGVPIINRPVSVRYLSKEEGGVSHFQLFRDNLRFSWLHTRLCTLAMWRWLRKSSKWLYSSRRAA